jgi:hypothetical protein
MPKTLLAMFAVGTLVYLMVPVFLGNKTNLYKRNPAVVELIFVGMAAIASIITMIVMFVLGYS